LSVKPFDAIIIVDMAISYLHIWCFFGVFQLLYYGV